MQFCIIAHKFARSSTNLPIQFEQRPCQIAAHRSPNNLYVSEQIPQLYRVLAAMFLCSCPSKQTDTSEGTWLVILLIIPQATNLLLFSSILFHSLPE